MKKWFVKTMLMLFLAQGLSAQVIPEMEFYNKPIRDILLALSDASGKFFVIDNTVTGSTSYFFKEMDVRKALDIFLSVNDCYLEIKDEVYYISKVLLLPGADGKTWSIDAENVYLQDIIALFSKKSSLTVVYDGLPRETISLHLKNATPETILLTLIKKYPDYSLEVNKGFYFIKYRPASRTGSGGNSVPIAVSPEGLYTIQVEQVRFRDTLGSLFLLAGREFLFLGKNDPTLASLSFRDKTFDEMLTLILDMGDSDYSLAGDVYYIVDIQRNDILKKYNTTVYLPLRYLNVMDLPGLFPNGLVNSAAYKVDKPNNALILFGTLSEIGPIQSFIEKIDQPPTQKIHLQYRLNFIEPDRVKGLLPQTLQMVEIIPVKETGSIIAIVTPEKQGELEEFLALIDNRTGGVPVRLKYIKADDLIAALPPSVLKDDIIKTNDPTLVFFRGSDEKKSLFFKELEMVDRPVPQIRYELLIIENSRDSKLNWDSSLDGSATVSDNGTGTDPSQTYSGGFDQLLSLSFDIVNSLGYQAALDLSLSLNTQFSRILTDTTLTGLSGQKISFQNTTTFRYQALVDDEDSGTSELGETQSISSGIFIDISGWVSGDGTITMEIVTTISKESDNSSDSSSDLPKTSERVVKTHVRTRSGEPVVISGLIEQEKVYVVDKIPVLGDIPLLGLLFQKRSERIVDTEMTIYLIPQVEGFDYDPDDIHYFERLTRRFLND